MTSATESLHERVLRWEHGSRFYLAHLHRDLFGQWGLTVVWGTRGGGAGGRKHHPAEDLSAAQALLAAVLRRREQRGYRLVDDRCYPSE